ncbi:helix-turn-helix domain-containing protein [Nonomuraea sp. NPDC050790]|uniref:helix-turn-helix domain-containing protein n=1 Tax=Nonomuraea sp. NPDC050790 TaxID=3364371 RepID=UPI00378CDDB2
MNLDDLYTAEEAAAEVGVERQTIYVWVSRGVLKPVPGVKRRRSNLFRLEDVFTAEKNRDHKHRRRSTGANLGLRDQTDSG